MDDIITDNNAPANDTIAAPPPRIKKGVPDKETRVI
jgi:hypothetical protein